MYINSWKYLQPQKWIGNISFGAFKEKLRDPKYKSGNILKLKKNISNRFIQGLLNIQQYTGI